MPDEAILSSSNAFTREGETVVQNRGKLNDRELHRIQKFIKKNYQEMYLKWTAYSTNGFYGEEIK